MKQQKPRKGRVDARLQQEIKERGLTVEQLAWAAGTTPSYLCSILRSGQMTTEMAERVAKVLRVRAADIITW